MSACTNYIAIDKYIYSFTHAHDGAKKCINHVFVLMIYTTDTARPYSNNAFFFTDNILKLMGQSDSLDGSTLLLHQGTINRVMMDKATSQYSILSLIINCVCRG